MKRLLSCFTNTRKALVALVALLLVITVTAFAEEPDFEPIAGNWVNIDDRSVTLQIDKDGSGTLTNTNDDMGVPIQVKEARNDEYDYTICLGGDDFANDLKFDAEDETLVMRDDEDNLIRFIRDTLEGMPNPWSEVADMDAFSEKAGFRFAVPEDAQNIVLRVMNTPADTVLGEMTFDINEMTYTARAAVSETVDNIEDISGLYYKWEYEEDTTIGGLYGTKAIIRQTADGSDTVEVVNWLDANSGIVYSLSTIQPDVDGLDLTAIADQLYIPMKSASDYTGRWILDTDATMSDLSEHDDIYVLFGSGLRDYGAEMIISEDGTFRCSVGVGFYLDGNWKFDGETLTAEGQNGVSEEATVSFVPVKRDGVEALCMNYENESVFWIRAAALPDEVKATVDVIREYGFYKDRNLNDGDSVLSFSFDSASLESVDGGYLMDVTLAKEIRVPGDLTVGESCVVTMNELTGETVEIVKTSEDGYYKEAGSDYDDEYYTFGMNDDGTYTLYEMSDDRVDCPFYKGKLMILNNAVFGIAVMDDYHAVTEENLSNDPWMNGVAIDQYGYVVSMVSYGD